MRNDETIQSESKDTCEFTGADKAPEQHRAPALVPSSPLHRRPEEDGDDHGCRDGEADARVAELVDELNDQIASGSFLDGDDLITAMRRGLESIGAGATDTIVKENVRNALLEAAHQAGLEVDWRDIYGW